MDSKTIRYQNTRYLVEMAGGVSNFAEKLEKDSLKLVNLLVLIQLRELGIKLLVKLKKLLKSLMAG